MKGSFHNIDFVSIFKHLTESEYELSKKQKDPISFSSSTTPIELFEDNEESNNIINFNITDASAFQNYGNVSMTYHSNKFRVGNLHPEDFHYLSYPHDRMHGENTPIFNSKNPHEFFGKTIS